MSFDSRAFWRTGTKAIERFFGADHWVLDNEKNKKSAISGCFFYRTKTVQAGSSSVTVREPAILIDSDVVKKAGIEVGSLVLATNENKERELFRVFETEPRTTGQTLLILKLHIDEESQTLEGLGL